MAINRAGDLLTGRYRLDDLMSETGSGEFWRGFDTVLARTVAIHAIPSDDPRAAALVRAAQASARVVESRFLRVLDIDTRADLTFVVNEWGAGTSLDHLLAGQGPLPPRPAAWLVDEVASALTVAHEAGVAHGRLNPENVLIDEAGSIRIIGFAVEAALYGLEGDRIGIDVIDLAALLQATLTGRWAGLSDSALARVPREQGALLDRGRERFLTPRQLQAGVPGVLDNLCDEVLNRPHGRHAGPNTAREIHEILAAYVGDPGDIEAEVAGLTSAGRSGPVGVGARSQGGGTATAVAPDPEPTGPLALTDLPTEAGTPIFNEGGDVGWFSPRGNRPTPPPPPEPVPERPLFAPEGERRPVLPETNTPSNDWIFSAPSGVDEEEAPGGGAWLRVALGVGVLALLLVAGVLAYALARPDSSPNASPSEDASATPTTATVIKGVSALDFDPESKPPTENRDLAPLAVDGNPGTSWRSVTYYQQLGPNGIKTGVGMVLDLHGSHTVTGLDLTFVAPGTTVAVYVTKSAPTSVEGLEPAQSLTAGTHEKLTLVKPETGGFVTLWFTALPQVSGGFRVELAEASVLGSSRN
ncbi:protein kinase family protein [Nocardioides sp. Kera G14]|uniref:protein kinase family protein n=1 Tax=Nocardioides sp. Kera G14 TaxID=2884264 RepID=UPI001D12219D|nr:protein kinase family protein [Nocardioides sp. Kera G14]UDY23573.1 protein kinase family protein [Nocardioides sp. Kera G14]